MKTKLKIHVNKRWIGLMACLAAVGLAQMGCGLASSPKKESQSLAGGAAAPLNARIVKAGLDPAIPDPSFDLNSPRGEDQVVASGGQLEFTANIHLPSAAAPQELFLVWNEAALGSPIVNVSAEHRLEGEANSDEGRPEHVAVHFEKTARVWFIPLKALYEAGGEGEFPSRRHRLDLTLHLEDGHREFVSIRLRLLGGGAPVTVGELEPAVEDAAALWANGSEGDIEIFKQNVTNPHPFAAEVRLNLPDTVTLQADWRIRLQGWELSSFKPVTLTPVVLNRLPTDDSYWLASAPRPLRTEWDLESGRLSGGIEATRLRVYAIAQSGPGAFQLMAERDLKIERGIRFRLGAHEQIQLRWLANSRTLKRCQLPAAFTRNLEWDEFPSGGVELNDWANGKYHQQGSYTETWSIQGLVPRQIQGFRWSTGFDPSPVKVSPPRPPVDLPELACP